MFPTEEGERVEMAQAKKDMRRYENGIAVGREAVQYRIRAGDSDDPRKYTLTTVPRPEAMAFKKTYVYPEYARKPNRVETEVTGDLDGLEGTTADLEIQVNQNVKVQSNLKKEFPTNPKDPNYRRPAEAHFAIEQGGKLAWIWLQATADPRRLRVQLPITTSATYRIHLTSELYGFENTFSPQYEIRSRADLVPRVILEEPSGDLLVPPDEVVAIKGSAKDDIGLLKVTQAVKVNQGDWKELPLSEDGGLEVKIGRMWDIYDLRVQPGDQVTTKLVAVDLKGSRAESAPVHLTISARGFDPQRLVPLVAKDAMYAELVNFQAAVRTDRQEGDRSRRDGEDRRARPQAGGDLGGGGAREGRDAGRLGGEPGEGRAARLPHGPRGRRPHPRGAAGEAAEGGHPPGRAGPAGKLRRARELLAAVDRADAVEDYYRDLLASEEAVAALNDVKDLARDQTAIHKQLQGALSIRDAKAYERLARRQAWPRRGSRPWRASSGCSGRGRPMPKSKRVTALKDSLAKSRTALKEALGKSMDEKLTPPSRAMNSQVQAALNTLHAVELDLARRAELARGHLDRVEPSFFDVQETVRMMQALAVLQAKAEKTDEGRAKEKDQSDLAIARWKAARIQLEAQAGVEEVHKDSIRSSSPTARWRAGRCGRCSTSTRRRRRRADPGDAADRREGVPDARDGPPAGGALDEPPRAGRGRAVERVAEQPHDAPSQGQEVDGRAVKTLPEDFKAAGLPAERRRRS